MKREIWIGLAQVRPAPDCEILVAKGAFVNVLAWATNATIFRKKVESMFRDYYLFLIDLQDEEPLAERVKQFSISEDIEDVVEEMQQQPDAVRYTTFFTYPLRDS